MRRSSSASNIISGSSRDAFMSTTASPTQSRREQANMEVTLDFDAGPGAIAASTIRPDTQQQPLAAKPKNLKSPHELGIQTTASQQEEEQPQQQQAAKILRKQTSGGHQRTIAAIQCLKSPAAAAAAANFKYDEVQPSMICSVAYKGAEMLFCTDSHNNVVGICARTRVTLQYLDVPGEVVLLSSNPANGMVIVGCSNGIVQTYHPVATSPKVTAYGRYRWMNGPKVDCRDLFQISEWTEIEVSSSVDYKLLVAYGKQLAVFLVAPAAVMVEESEVLWTTKVGGTLVSARISGDGLAIAYVLEGEGTINDNPYGVRTLLQDEESHEESPSSTRSLGIVYRPGPFLVHTAPVTSMSFRGFGQTTSEAGVESDGNDLLMTVCESENDVRIFSQNSWKQLIHWTTPPQTKADWVRGLSAFNLGDLESRKGVKKSTPSSQAPSRRQSFTSGTDESGGTAAFQAGIANQSFQPTSHANSTPSTAAGAWIAEITFRSAFPALRLSRLSYLKRGNDDAQPAHFESVSAILPAGSIISQGALSHDMGLSVQGIWPAWHPWNSDGQDDALDGSLRGSAMDFLGVSTTAGMGDVSQGGTHSPPSELRVMASHPKSGNVVLMEFPLWGDQDFGAMELGSPLRYLLSVSQIQSLYTRHAVSCLDYEFNKLCAQIEDGSKAVSITWRKQGNHSLLPADEEDAEHDHLYSDFSVLPVPLSLPSLRLPASLDQGKDESIITVLWWPDEHRGGPPKVLCFCSSGTLILYEMPPPWSALEPVMPSYDPLGSSANASVAGSDMNSDMNDDASDGSGEKKEYEVMITPHPEFGIGLRLESQMDGMPAIAGSFKQHPLNGGRLPAERTGMIMLGDELLSVGGVSLEGITFDEIIATVRQVGGDAKPGSPLGMRFRPVMANRRRNNGSTGFSKSDNSEISGTRRSKEQILGLSQKSYAKQPATPMATRESSVTAPDRHMSEIQQEFARIIAVVRGAVPVSSADDAKSRVLLMQWTCITGAPTSEDLRGAALLVVAEGNQLHAKRLEVSIDCDPEKARCMDLGSYNFQHKIKSIQMVKTLTDHWGINVCDEKDCSHLVFVSVQDDNKVSTSKSSLTASFRQFPMVAQTTEASLLRTYSSQLLGTMPAKREGRRLVTIWSGKPDSKTAYSVEDIDKLAEMKNDHTYLKSDLSLDKFIDDDDSIVDFRFVSTGLLDGFPMIVVFTQKIAVVHTRAGGKQEWTPFAKLRYPFVRTSSVGESRSALCDTTLLSPADSLPHLTSSLVSLVDSSDETDFIRSDWHPDSVLSLICTDNQGPLVSLRRNVKGLYEWLSGWTHPDGDSYAAFNYRARLGVAPLNDLHGQTLLATYTAKDLEEDTTTSTEENAATLMSMLTAKKPVVEENPQRLALSELQNVLCPSKAEGKRSRKDKAQPAHQLPPPLRTLNRDELRLLWSIGEIVSSPPKFKSLDARAQHSLFCSSLMKQLKEAKQDEEEEECKQSTRNGSSVTASPSRNSHFSRRQSFAVDEGNKKYTAIAASGAFAALVSNTQTALIELCRPATGKFDWESARALRLPFWVRSDDLLRKLSEEIGMRVYRETKDVMESALFFIITGNMKTLKNLAATDSSTRGSTFFKFLSSYDFSTAHGRKAAEKNAYSLLRKNRYNVAASFFLMSKPPMLKTALEIMVSKTGDLDLAFLTARLVEATAEREAKSPLPGGLALGSLGGGGGFAGSGVGVGNTAVADETTYEEWKPKLGKASKQLLRDRGLEMAKGERCLRSLQLVWLCRNGDAAKELTGTDAADVDSSFPESFDTPLKKTEESMPQRASYPFHAPVAKKAKSANDRVLQKANDVINFVSRPFLLKAMKSSVRSRWASTLLVCNSLTRRGIELSAARCILQNTDMADLHEEAKPKLSNTKSEAGSSIRGAAAAPQSSIFDSYEAPKQKSTSIFDSFDAPPRKTANIPNPQSGQATSSIFDGFDAAPFKPKRTQQAPQNQAPQNGGTSSSIFDGFDAAPQKPKQPTQSQSGQMASSIFDSFDAAPPKPKPPAQSQSGAMASSIFDSFDTPAKTQPPKAKSILDSYDAAPTSKATATTNAASTQQNEEEEEAKEEPELPSLPTPQIWMEWRNGLLIKSVARRLLRELGRHIDRFHVDLVDPPIEIFCTPAYPLIPSSAAEILRTVCEGEQLLDTVSDCLGDVCKSFRLDEAVVVEQAFRILDVQSQPKRLVLATLLHIATDRADLAEDVIRDAAIAQMQRCDIFALSQDNLVDDGNTVHHKASQHMRRLAVRVSWQLELCLWLHRGGVVPLSDIVLKEAIVAVRVGLVLASWGENHECLDSLVKNDPDCPLDYTGGRQLWSSMKMIAGLEEGTKKIVTKGSGGWEFLVDCRREEATTMLRKRQPGSFIIRPHPDDNGVFTLSFKTNLKPIAEVPPPVPDGDSSDGTSGKPPLAPSVKSVKKDDVVQHAIMRLSDAGFRCGSFGPFTTLLKLLEAVSESLPFDLLFHKPPTEGIIKEDDQHQPSPNAVFLRKFALSAHSDVVPWDGVAGIGESFPKMDSNGDMDSSHLSARSRISTHDEERDACEYAHLHRFGAFSQLLTLTEIRKQLSAVASADYGDVIASRPSWDEKLNDDDDDDNSVESLSERAPAETLGVEERYAIASRLVRPFLTWCHAMEVQVIHSIAPELQQVSKESHEQTCAVAFTESSIELAPREESSVLDGGDAMIRQMIQPESGVEFRTLRVGEGGDSAMIVLFSQSDAMEWVKSSGMEKTDKDVMTRLGRMEERRVIEQIALSDLHLKTFSQNNSNESEDVMCYRFVDPWEVEALENREGETMAAALGREHYLAFSVNSVANSCEAAFRKLGGLHLLGLWSSQKGGLRVTKAVASVHAPWERDSGGDLQMAQGTLNEPTAFQNSIRRHLYRNTLFRRLEMPQRFLALVQVELLDLKNLNAAGAASLSVYALLRLKRPGSSAPLTQKARTLDSAATTPMKIGKSSGPNAPASWGSLVRFRFPLPEEVSCDGVSYDSDREALFRGPPCVLQLSVYEKKFMSDINLGDADVKLDALTSGGQMEEWVPLRSEKHGINWFARIRLTLRFELMCLPTEDNLELPKSVGLSKIRQLSKAGGTHEDKMKKSASTPDILSYFESMVY